MWMTIKWWLFRKRLRIIRVKLDVLLTCAIRISDNKLHTEAICNRINKAYADKDIPKILNGINDLFCNSILLQHMLDWLGEEIFNWLTYIHHY